ncbi:MAG TPA: hypothetical protein VFQ23_19745 [Anaerolineales bacterium]|nr:hypothetical protein [Anaerolineales bacterium]
MSNKHQLVNWIITTLREAAWAPLGVVGFYAIGLAFDWYDRFPPLDMPSHLLGGVAITYFYISAIKHSQRIVGEIPGLIQTLLAFTSTGTTIIFWEFYENAADWFLGTQMVRGLEDTIVDMLVGLTGALILVLLYKRRS